MSKDIGILVVDDEPTIREVFSKVFESAGFHNVCCAQDGVECLSILAKRRDSIHVVIMDEMMPRLTGTETLEYLAQVHPYIVGILFVSGFISRANYEAKAGKIVSSNIISVGFLPKPVNFDLLVAKVEEAGELVKKKRAANLSIEHLEIGTALARIEGKIDGIQSSSKRSLARFLQDLGLELLKIIVIGIAVLLLLSSGIDDLIRGLLSTK